MVFSWFHFACIDLFANRENCHNDFSVVATEKRYVRLWRFRLLCHNPVILSNTTGKQRTSDGPTPCCLYPVVAHVQHRTNPLIVDLTGTCKEPDASWFETTKFSCLCHASSYESNFDLWSSLLRGSRFQSWGGKSPSLHKTACFAGRVKWREG